MWQGRRTEDNDHMSDSSPLAQRRRSLRYPCLFILAFALLLPLSSALAQDTIVVGRGGIPEVEINLDAIEFPTGRMTDRMEESASFGAFRSKGLLMPGSKVPPGERIVLTPPGSHPAAKTPRLKPPRTKQAKAGVPQLKLNIPETSSTKPAMPKPPKVKPAVPAKAKKPAPTAATEIAATPPEPAPIPEPAVKAKAEPEKAKAKAADKPAPKPKKEPKKAPKKEPQLAAKAEKKAMPEPPAAPPPPPEVDMKPEPTPPAPPVPAAKETAMKAPEAAKSAPAAPPPAPDTASTDDGGLTPPPLPDLPDLPPPPPAASLELPPLPKETVQEAPADLPPPPPLAEEPAKSADATEPVPMPEPVLPQPQEVAAPEESEQGKSKQVAALPPPSTTVPTTGPLTVLFSPGSAILNAEASERIAAVREKMDADKTLRLQLVAYATSTDDNPSRARRLSLSRALAIRSYLVEKDVKSTRMDVRALGNKFEEAPGDRVDLVLLP